VKCLIEYGADVRRGEKGCHCKPLHEAIFGMDTDRINQNMMEMVKLLINYKKHRLPSHKLCTLNNNASNADDASDADNANDTGEDDDDLAEKYPETYWIVNTPNDYGETALNYVIEKMSNPDEHPHYNMLLNTLQYLLDQGADPRRPDYHDGRTVFYMAVLWDLQPQTPVLEATLRRLLEHTVAMGPAPASSLLCFEYDSGFDGRDKKGLTAMHVAVQAGRERALSLLLEYGARVDLVSKEGSTVLHDAVCYGPNREEYGNGIGEGRDRPDREDDDNDEEERVLHDAVPFAIERDQKVISCRMVRIILQHLENHGDFRPAMIQDKDGNTALHVAIQDRKLSTVRVFCGDEPWAPLFTNAVINNRGETPLHGAVRTEYVAMLSFLLQNNADASVRDASGRTPLTLACELGHLDAIFILFMHGQGFGLRMF